VSGRAEAGSARRLPQRSAAGAAPPLRPLGEALQRPPEGIYFLTSCAPGEVSQEDPTLGHGVFMHFVLEGLRGAADVDHRGGVSLLELCSYATKETKLFVLNKYSQSQRPSYRVEATDDFDIVSSLGAGAAPATNSIGMKLSFIPAAEFLVGSPASDKDAGADEKPQHRVKIAQPFYLGTYPVTLGEFLQFRRDSGYKLERERDGQTSWGYDEKGEAVESAAFRPWAPGWKVDDSHPVVYVTCGDALAFCRWLSRKEGQTYRLPTEAEWEYACRAGSTTCYSFGDDEKDLSDYAWYDDGKNGKGVGTHPVGKKRPNAFGLYDMHGNVFQMCVRRPASYWEYAAANAPDDDLKIALEIARGRVSQASPDDKHDYESILGCDLSAVRLADQEGKAVDWARSSKKARVFLLEFPHGVCGNCEAAARACKDLMGKYASDDVRFDLVNVFPDLENSNFSPGCKEVFVPLTDADSVFKKRFGMTTCPVVVITDKGNRVVFVHWVGMDSLKESTDMVLSRILQGAAMPTMNQAIATSNDYARGILAPYIDAAPASVSAGDLVARGGCWKGEAGLCRSAHREAGLESSPFCGFRVVLVPAK
jgi:formylglycine-generating enzyme required for sulfatase activity